MKKIYFLFLLGSIILAVSCIKRKEDDTPTCSYKTSEKLSLFSQRWLSIYTQTDTYNAGGTKTSTVLTYPLGYFQLNGTNTYNSFIDSAPLDGSWTINTNCQLVLDSGKTAQRNFDVMALTADSLTIRRKANNVVYTQHYKTFFCPTTISSIQFQWDNAIIRSDYYANATSNTIIGSGYSYSAGYFKINADATYNVVSGGDIRSGKWSVEPVGCKLVLDKATITERAFDIIKFTSDSLVIWRRDNTINTAYTQHYKKH